MWFEFIPEGDVWEMKMLSLRNPHAISNINADVVEFGCTLGNNGDNATITIDGSAITGGSGNYVRYEFVDGGSTVVQSGASNVLTVTDRTGDSYTINVYDDKGCSGSTTATVLPFDEITGATAAVTIRLPVHRATTENYGYGDLYGQRQH